MRPPVVFDLRGDSEAPRIAAGATRDAVLADVIRVTSLSCRPRTTAGRPARARHANAGWTTNDPAGQRVGWGVLDRPLRPLKRRALAPLTRALRGVRPGRITALALASGLLAALAAALGAFGAALAAWLTNRVLDGVDGEVARAQAGRVSSPERGPQPADGAGSGSDRGGYFDLLGDLTVYAAVTLGVAAGAAGTLTGRPLAPATTTWALAALVLASYYVNLGSLTLLSALLEKRGWGAAVRGEPTSVTLPDGLIEGTETLLLVTLMLALPSYAPTLFAVTAALVIVTAAQRAYHAARVLEGT
jgi:phosphatidylglycerophosphate synthase